MAKTTSNQTADNKASSGSKTNQVKKAPSSAAQPVHKEGWVHHHLILAIAIFIVVVIAGGFIISSILGNSKSSTNQILVQQAALSSNQTVGVNQLKALEAGGLSAPELDVRYSGAATFTISVVRIRAPINVTFQKYYNRSRIDVEVSDLPLISGNLSFIDVKNGSVYYSCFGSGKTSKGAENYSCSEQPQYSTLFSILNLSNTTTSSQYGSLAIHFAQLNESSYNNMPCTNTAGYFSYSNYTAQAQAQGEVPNQGNLTFETCVSDTYKLPLTLYAEVSGVKSSSISSIVLNLQESYISTNSSSGITALPAVPT